MELASEPYPNQAFLPTDSCRTGNINDPPVIESHAFGPFELRSGFLLLGSFEDLVRIGVGGYLQFIVDRGGIAFGTGEHGRIQIDQYAPQVGPNTSSSRITVAPVRLSIEIGTGVVEHLVMLVRPIEAGDLLDVVPLADDAVYGEAFPAHHLSHHVEYFGGLLLDTEVYHIPVEAAGKEKTAIGIFQYDIREAAVTAEGDMIVFVRFVAMDFQDQSGIQRWLGNITQYRFMIPIKLTDFLTQHDAAGDVLFVVVRHAEECQTENLFVLRQLCQQGVYHFTESSQSGRIDIIMYFIAIIHKEFTYSVNASISFSETFFSMPCLWTLNTSFMVAARPSNK